MTLSLRSQFAIDHPTWEPATVWATAIITGLFFFVSLLLHELSHAAVAKLRGIPVRAITLFALGGVAQIGRNAEMMGREDVNQILVIQRGKLEGIISRAHILRVLQARAELDV